MISYFNLVDKNDKLERPFESWGLFKRNASSYTKDLAWADQSDYKVILREGNNYPNNVHDFNQWIPSEHTVRNYGWKLDLCPSNFKILIRDPLHRYCSGLNMLMFDLEEPWTRNATMPPQYHNGGREEILENYSEFRGEQDVRLLYCWRQFLRQLNSTLWYPGNRAIVDYTFGESHLDPTLTFAGLLPYFHKDAVIHYPDLKKWTEYTTKVLGINEEADQVNRWNTPKLEKRRDKIAQPGLNMFKVLQNELPHFTKDKRAYDSKDNWQPTFEDWLEPEAGMYHFFKNNPVIANGSDEMDKLTDLFCEMLEKPYFLMRAPIVRRNFCNPQLQAQFPKRLRACIKNCVARQVEYELSFDHRRFNITNK